ncbi:Ig-like domain-containing protein [Granulicella aggregans]|uniref:Ig-like domain-containing protein n=1 Tax=Granulicella aggregans TaxID=474949 RepID=UPI0021DF738E|nr:Ig-like domain-containing protein [Granulicella aggregans]
MHPADSGLYPTTVGLYLCVKGSTDYPCPDPPISDRTIISDIVITYGQTVSGDAQVSSAIGGTLTFYEDTTPFCTIPAYFQETYCPSFGGPFDAGTHVLTAVFSGDPVYAGSTSNAVQVTVLPEVTTAVLRSSLNPAGQGQPVTFTAVFSGKYTPPTGPVVFYDGETPIATAALDGTGTAFFTTSTLAPGPHAITARFAGSLDFLASQSNPIEEQIVPGTETSIESNLNPSATGQNVTFTATVSTSVASTNRPAGTVSFRDGSRTFAAVPVTSKGTLNVAQTTISTLGVGTHSITAMYSGDSANSSSVSPVLVQQVNNAVTSPPYGYTLTVTPTPVSVLIGQTATLTVTVTPFGGFMGPVGLSCSDMPNESACSFTDATIPSGGGSTTLNLSTTFPHGCGSNLPYGSQAASKTPGAGVGRVLSCGVCALAGVLLFLRKRRTWFNRLLGLVVICGIAGLSGCSGNCTDFGTAPGHYTFKVNGAAPSNTQGTTGGTATSNVSTSVALTVEL